jgi:hypothetical protein
MPLEVDALLLQVIYKLCSACEWAINLEQGMNKGDHAGVDLSLCLHPLDLPRLPALTCAWWLAQLQQLIALTHNSAD